MHNVLLARLNSFCYVTSMVSPAAGALAGCTARFVVGPLDVIKIRFQVQLEPIAKRSAELGRGAVASKYTGLRQALTTILKEEGVPVSVTV